MNKIVQRDQAGIVRYRICFLTGPTASGKSELALRLAQQWDAEIVNCDSMQVYKDLTILSARPLKSDMAQTPHHLYGHIDGSVAYDVAAYARDAARSISDILDRGRQAIVVGGTGLYFKALIDGLAKIPDIPDSIRREVLVLAEQSAEALYNALMEEDPLMARRLNMRDRQRVGRALEVVRATGKSISAFQDEPHHGPLAAKNAAGEIAKISLIPDRDKLYDRCNKRLDKMIRAGAMEEIRVLLNRGLPDRFPVMRALGVPQLRRYLEDQTDMEQAYLEAAMHTRRFAKRQLTWIRNQFESWQSYNLEYNYQECEKLSQIISKNLLT